MCKLKKRYKFHTTILLLTVWRVEFISLWLREDVTIKHKRGKKDHDSLLPPRSRSASVYMLVVDLFTSTPRSLSGETNYTHGNRPNLNSLIS